MGDRENPGVPDWSRVLEKLADGVKKKPHFAYSALLAGFTLTILAFKGSALEVLIFAYVFLVTTMAYDYVLARSDRRSSLESQRAQLKRRERAINSLEGKE